jgi:hypothetical protein
LRRLVWSYGADTVRLTRDANTWPAHERHLVRYLAILALLNALDGDPPQDYAHLAELGLGLVDSALVTQASQAKQYGRYGSVFEEEAVALWHHLDDRSALSSRDIFEAFALETESIYAVAMGRSESSPTNLVDYKHYTQVVRLAMKYFGHIRERKLPIEVDACMDLALWIPLTLRGNWFRKRGWTWFDLEPGHRLIKAFEFLSQQKDHDFHFAEDGLSLTHCDQAYQEIQAKVCAGLGWPTPSELAEGLIEEIDDLDETVMTANHFAVLHENSPRLNWSRTMLRKYLKEPFSAFYPTFSIRQYSEDPIWFPAGIFGDKDFQMTGTGLDSDNSQWNEYQILTTLRMMIEGPIAHPMPRFHAATGLELAGVYGEGLLGEPGLRAKMVSIAKTMLSLPDDRPPFPRSA